MTSPQDTIPVPYRMELHQKMYTIGACTKVLAFGWMLGVALLYPDAPIFWRFDVTIGILLTGLALMCVGGLVSPRANMAIKVMCAVVLIFAVSAVTYILATPAPPGM